MWYKNGWQTNLLCILLSGNFRHRFSQQTFKWRQINNKLVHQFLKLFSRYFSNAFKKCERYRYNVCDNCTVVLKDFIELYSQMDCLRLKLNWRIETLKILWNKLTKFHQGNTHLDHQEKIIVEKIITKRSEN